MKAYWNLTDRQKFKRLLWVSIFSLGLLVYFGSTQENYSYLVYFLPLILVTFLAFPLAFKRWKIRKQR